METPLVSKSLKIDLQKSPDIFGYDWFFLETPSSYRKKNSHTCDSEKVGSYITLVWHVRPFVQCKNSRNVVLFAMILFIKSQGFATYIYSADY